MNDMAFSTLYRHLDASFDFNYIAVISRRLLLTCSKILGLTEPPVFSLQFRHRQFHFFMLLYVGIAHGASVQAKLHLCIFLDYQTLFILHHDDLLFARRIRFMKIRSCFSGAIAAVGVLHMLIFNSVGNSFQVLKCLGTNCQVISHILNGPKSYQE